MPQLGRGGGRRSNLRDCTIKAKMPFAQAKELLLRMPHFRHYTCFHKSSVKTILTVITGPRNQHMKRKRYSTLVKKKKKNKKKTCNNHYPPPTISKTGTLQLPSFSLSSRHYGSEKTTLEVQINK